MLLQIHIFHHTGWVFIYTSNSWCISVPFSSVVLDKITLANLLTKRTDKSALAGKSNRNWSAHLNATNLHVDGVFPNLQFFCFLMVVLQYMFTMLYYIYRFQTFLSALRENTHSRHWSMSFCMKYHCRWNVITQHQKAPWAYLKDSLKETSECVFLLFTCICHFRLFTKTSYSMCGIFLW